MSAAERPNILWICTDQQRYDTIGCLGNPWIRTPNLDRLCAEGVALTHAYCQSPICTPSRASFLTGLYPSTVHANINGAARFRLPDRARLVTGHLRDQGYHCALAGKLHLASPWNGIEERVDDGYEEVWYSESGMHHYRCPNSYGEWLRSIGRFDEVLDTSEQDIELRRGIRYRENVPLELHQTTWCADQAIEFIERRHRGPWLFSVNTFDPHPPYDAPDDYRRRYEASGVPQPLFRESDLEVQRRLRSHTFQTQAKPPGAKELRDKASYYGMVEIIDTNVGRLLDSLERTGQRDNTIVVFMSDHGEMLGDHGLQLKGCRFYEGLVRVPLVFSWPGRFATGVRSDALVELTDIAPTLALLGGEPLPWSHGRSLLPILEGRGPVDPHRNHVRCEYYDVLANWWGTGRDPEPPSYATMHRDEQYKMAVYHGSEYGELYDLSRDPGEHENLWEDPGHLDVRCRMIKASFDATAMATDPGSVRIGRY